MAETATKEKRMAFTRESVLGIKAERKWQTRRVIAPQPDSDINPIWMDDHECWQWATIDSRRRSPYQPGDIIVPTCTWAVKPAYDDLKPSELPGEDLLVWSWWVGDEKPKAFGKFRPGRFLPKHLWWAFPRLEITEVRVERLNSISAKDAIAEGCEGAQCKCTHKGSYGCTCCLGSGWEEPPQVGFMDLWNSINKQHPWESNPYVWAYSFKRRES